MLTNRASRVRLAVSETFGVFYMFTFACHLVAEKLPRRPHMRPHSPGEARSTREPRAFTPQLQPIVDAAAQVDNRDACAVCGNWSGGSLAKVERWTLPHSR